ncbi:hypothetical protein Pelo_18794 [Pelomyxa schiedti]|nr:hypothetical protein Pelo_18794 [Pelomyxa schiedti]
MPDGSVSTLHLNFSSAGLYLVNSITHQRHKFPERHNATVIDQSHLLVAPWFETTHYQVYHTSNLLEASRCVPSTWASVGQSGGFALICSTTQPQGRSDATEIQFEVRDGATGILLGVFPVPIHPPFCLRV